MDLMIVTLLWVCVIPSALKYRKLTSNSDYDEKKIKSAKNSFYWSLFIAIGGTLAVLLGI